MHCLLFTDTFPHLSETFVIAHARGLDADVVSLYGDPDRRHELGFNDPERYRVLAPEGVSAMRRQRLQRRLRQRWCGDGVLPWPHAIERGFRRVLEARQPDVVLAEFGYNAMYCGPAVKRRGVPLVTHFHGADTTKYLKRPKYRRALPGVFADSAAVIVVSSDMARRIRELGCPPDKIHNIPCGADLSRFAPVERNRSQTAECRFVAVGRFVGFKGPLHTVEAFARCRERTPCHLTMIGDGPLLDAARRRAESLGVSADTTFAGAQSHTQVRDALNASDVFVHHAITSDSGQVEGWGVAIAEASASGMPSVTTNHGGIPDQVRDGHTGFLVPEGDIDAMAARMLELAVDADKRAMLGRAARALVETVGDQRLQTQKLAHVLERQAAPRAVTDD